MQRLPQGFVIDSSRIVELSDITSMECYADAEGRVLRRALNSITFSVAGGQRFALVGDDPFDLKLLTEIIGNIKPYESGRCSLVGLGMMREKQRILQHVYYINDQGRAYPHMQGLSYLMFASRRVVKNAVDRQLLWLDRLMEFGLEQLCFTYVRNMAPAARVLMHALLALDSKSPLLLLDLSHIGVPESLRDAFCHVLRRLADGGKTIVFSTMDTALADACATHAALLVGGRVRALHAGALEELYALDKRLYILETSDDAAARAVIEGAYPLRAEECGGRLCVYGEKGCAPRPSGLLAALEDAGVSVRRCAASAPSLAEVMKAANREVD
jgi:ABC-2 type transport system ATP-binding protein